MSKGGGEVGGPAGAALLSTSIKIMSLENPFQRWILGIGHAALCQEREGCLRAPTWEKNRVQL